MRQKGVVTGFLLSIVAGQVDPARAANNPNTDWFHAAKYGVFVHYLEDLQNDPEKVHSLGRRTSWDACVREFDVPRFAEAMSQAGAGYVIFTMHQRTRFLIAPNATFDRMVGYSPGEACAARDLVEDLWQALHARHIPLMLYWTGDGPRQDPKAAAAMGWTGNVTTEYVERWASVVREYAERYGEKVAGWWVDGSYPFIGYDQPKLAIMARALRAGNPRRIIAFNPGVLGTVQAYSPHEDYTCGEENAFRDRPVSRWINGEQWHILSFLGSGASHIGAAWAMPGVRYSKQEMIEYVHEVSQAGGVVSIDVLLFRDGGLDRSQLEVLKALRPGLAAAKDQPPIPPGNLAFRKPSRLLSLDGERELPINGDVHLPRYGVDGRAETTAMGAGEWPWTYEVDLLEPEPVQRIDVMFAPDRYATNFDVRISADKQEWRSVASVSDNDQTKHAFRFSPTKARYIQVRAIKPDGPDQKGRQMAVAELAAFDSP